MGEILDELGELVDGTGWDNGCKIQKEANAPRWIVSPIINKAIWSWKWHEKDGFYRILGEDNAIQELLRYLINTVTIQDEYLKVNKKNEC